MTQHAMTVHQDDDLPVPSGGALTPMAMIDRAVASGAGIEVLERLMALQERYEANQGRKAFDAAMAAVRDDLPAIVKNREVDFTSPKGRTHYRHEDLHAVTAAISPVLAKHGLSFRWRTDTKTAPGTVIVTCIISHRDGYCEETSLDAGHDNSGNKNSIQAIGSTVTYLQRYTLKAALGLAAAEDDGGQAANLPITPKQLEFLRAEVESVGADTAAFCKTLGIESLPELPADKFDRAIRMLAQKRMQTK